MALPVSQVTCFALGLATAIRNLIARLSIVFARLALSVKAQLQSSLRQVQQGRSLGRLLVVTLSLSRSAVALLLTVPARTQGWSTR